MQSALIKLWEALPVSERAEFIKNSKEDLARYDREYAEWADAGLAEKELVALEGCLNPAQPKPRKKRCRELVPVSGGEQLAAGVNVCPAQGEMGEVLSCAIRVGGEKRLLQQRQRRQKLRAARAALGVQRGSAAGTPRAGEEGDLLGDFTFLMEGADGSAGPVRSPEGLRPPVAEGNIGGLPRGAGAGEALGASRSFLPQLCLDECGNIVLDQTSLSSNLNIGGPDESAPVVDALDVTLCQSAYARKPSVRWTPEEIELLHEAFATYGTDFFLIETLFRKKTHAHIKAMYNKLLKRDPARVSELLTTGKRELTPRMFEKVNGRIDVSTHFRPPCASDDEGLPVPFTPGTDAGRTTEPESLEEEDAAAATRRLMELFDL